MKPFFRLLLVLLLVGLLSACAAQPAEPGAAANSTESNPNGNTIIQTEVVVIGLLLLAAVVNILTGYLRIPYTVGLVLVGFGLSFLGELSLLNLAPEVILAILVPPLIFEAAYHLNFSDLRRDLPLILTLAVLGVVLTTLLVGGLVAAAAQISLPVALVFGALISATDPVAVIALFRSMGAPKRLQTLLEGESLLNDGTAIVLYNLMLAIALTGQFHLGRSILDFFVSAGGGILIGGVAGLLISRWISRIDNHLVETGFTTILAYGSFLLAQYGFGVSGVLAVVAAGLASGQIGPRGMSPTTRIVVFNFWEYAAFLANSFIFLIIGLQMDVAMLIRNAPVIGWAILAVLVARAVTVYGLSWIGKGVPLRWQNIMFWGGLRGAISLALALSLPSEVPDRSQLQAMTFGVVLFTLVVEGLTMRPLMRRSGMLEINTVRLEYEKIHARSTALRAAQTRIAQLNHAGMISDYTWRSIRPVLEAKSHELAREIRTLLKNEPGLHQEELADAWREALRTQRSTLIDLYRDNVIPEEVYEELVKEVDLALVEPDSTFTALAPDDDDQSVPAEAKD